MQETTLQLSGLLANLVADGCLSDAVAEQVLHQPKTTEERAQHPITWLASQDLVNAQNGRKLDEQLLVEWLAQRYQLPIFHIDPLKVPVADVAGVMSFEFANRNHILCVEVSATSLTIACEYPDLTGWIPQLEQITRKTIQRVLACPSEVNRFRLEFYMLARSVLGAKKDAGRVRQMEPMLEIGNRGNPDANDQHIVNIVDWLLQYAFDQRASDIHLEPRRDKAQVRFRIDGILHSVYALTPEIHLAVVSRIKVLGRMNVAEKRRPQDGRIKTRRPDGSEVELRLSSLPTAFGEKLVMRIFDPQLTSKSFYELGLAGSDLTEWASMLKSSNGIIFVTGPTGSGKTSTLYTSLKSLATEKVNVSTIEDPIEMVEPSFNQTQVQHNIELDFAAGIRTLMRQDPDIIMVGEVRDSETAHMAIQAALTGHLVLSTLHTNDAITGITRLQDLGLPSYLIRSTLLGVMAQRLVRTLCPHCKEEGELDADAWRQLTEPWKVTEPKKVYAPVGCLECRNTGFLGRIGIHEILTMDPKLQGMLTDDMNVNQFRREAWAKGMKSLRLSGANKVARGLTTISEVLAVTPAPMQLRSS